MEAGTLMLFDLTIQRHQIAKSAQDNGWGRSASPHVDRLVFPRAASPQTHYVEVAYDEDGRVSEATHTDVALGNAQSYVAGPSAVDQVLYWLKR